MTKKKKKGRSIRRKPLFYDLKEKREHWKLKEEGSTNRTLCRTACKKAMDLS
jgi:hypothetical protein